MKTSMKALWSAATWRRFYGVGQWKAVSHRDGRAPLGERPNTKLPFTNVKRKINAHLVIIAAARCPNPNLAAAANPK